MSSPAEYANVAIRRLIGEKRDAQIRSRDFSRSQTRQQAHDQADTPFAVIFDIDSTVMNTEPRNLAILRELAEINPEFAPSYDRIHREGVGWNIVEALERVGLEDKTLLAQAREFWHARFFTDDYVFHDTPYPGAVACINQLILNGFSILFVTGRDAPGMRRGTLQHFADHGIQEGSRVRFFFKPSFKMADSEFKRKFCREAADRYTISATIENEPRNANMFARAFPDALHFWIDTITSPHREPLRPEVIRFSRY